MADVPRGRGQKSCRARVEPETAELDLLVGGAGGGGRGGGNCWQKTDFYTCVETGSGSSVGEAAGGKDIPLEAELEASVWGHLGVREGGQERDPVSCLNEARTCRCLCSKSSDLGALMTLKEEEVILPLKMRKNPIWFFCI